MIKSMTGYGRCDFSSDSRKVTVEIKSVNHRFLDMNLRIPRKLNFLDNIIRNTVKSKVIRGKVDIAITYNDDSDTAASLTYNKELAAAYYGYLKEMENDFSLRNDISASVLARFPEVFSMQEDEENETQIEETVINALIQAIDSFNESRAIEGEALKNDLLEKLQTMLADVAKVEERYPQILAEHENKLRTRLSEFLEEKTIEEGRIAAELVLFADKLCTDEEIVRLKNHINTAMKTLKDGGEIGKRLDFIAQEMNREANTIMSKSNDLRTSEIGIALKTGIEKVREQIQNIE